MENPTDIETGADGLLRSAGEVEGDFKPLESWQLPQVPDDRSDEMRTTMAHWGRTDLYYLTRAILGYDKLTLHTHAKFCRFVETVDQKRTMTLMPRGHYKTTIRTISRSIQRVTNNPETRILLTGASGANAERFLKEIQNHFQNNQLFRWLYPEMIPTNFKEVRWNAGEMEVPRKSHWREPTIDTIGSRGASESRHYDEIVVDDPIGMKEMESETEMERVIEWMSGLESLLNSPVWGEIHVVGTRWRLGDVYEWFEDFYSDEEEPVEMDRHAYKRGALAVFHREAEEDGEVIFPEEFSKEFFARLRIKRPMRYAAQYANNPIASGILTFKSDWLRYFKYQGAEGRSILYKDSEGVEKTVHASELDVLILVDPAIATKKRTHARCAILVTGMMHRVKDPIIFLLETRIGHYPPDECVETIFEFTKKWSPGIVSIEKYGYQGALRYWISQYANLKKEYEPPVQEFPPEGSSGAQRAKDSRIEGLQPLFRSHMIYVLPTETEFIEEYTHHTVRGTVRYRDALDAFAQMLELYGVGFDEEEEEEWRKEEQKILAMIGPSGYGPRLAQVVQ